MFSHQSYMLESAVGFTLFCTASQAIHPNIHTCNKFSNNAFHCSGVSFVVSIYLVVLL